MRIEKLQFNMLCEQSTRNVWRKITFKLLCDNLDKMGRGKVPNENVQDAIDVFRERIDYTIENIVPKKIRFAEKLSQLAQDYQAFLTNKDDANTVAHLHSLLTNSEQKAKEKKKETSVD